MCRNFKDIDLITGVKIYLNFNNYIRKEFAHYDL